MGSMKWHATAPDMGTLSPAWGLRILKSRSDRAEDRKLSLLYESRVAGVKLRLMLVHRPQQCSKQKTPQLEQTGLWLSTLGSPHLLCLVAPVQRKEEESRDLKGSCPSILPVLTQDKTFGSHVYLYIPVVRWECQVCASLETKDQSSSGSWY